MVSLIFALLFAISWPTLAHTHEDFLQCLSSHSQNPDSISQVIFTQNNSSYSSILEFSIQNLRFMSAETPKPSVIVTPVNVSQIQVTIKCAKFHNVQIRVRSGGHDYEGLSYVSDVPFVIVDLINLQSITVDEENNTAWVQAGATIGQVFYQIYQKSKNYAFPAGVSPTTGVGGHFSGGGYGALLRKYGLAADHVIDAQIINVKGELLDRKTMGEDLFWAIRGGGGASFGVIIAWKISLVYVPTTVTGFNVDRNLEQNATKLVHKWQHIAHKWNRNLFLRIILRSDSTQNGGKTIRAQFNSLYLGGVDKFRSIIDQNFPELKLVETDYKEMSWIEAVLFLEGFPEGESPEVLLNRTQPSTRFFKAKSDYVEHPISEIGLEGLWEKFYELDNGAGVLIFTPYGGKMDEISENAIPFPHRKGKIFKIQHVVFWDENGIEASDKHISWIRRVYDYMGPFVTKSPRNAYLNYRDLDIGRNYGNFPSYENSSIWGFKYFKTSNFDRLVRVKSMVDPTNFFQNEQSIPPISS